MEAKRIGRAYHTRRELGRASIRLPEKRSLK
jgi:hypothetical protein